MPVSWLFERVAARHGVVTAARRITLRTAVQPGAEHVRGDGRGWNRRSRISSPTPCGTRPTGVASRVTASRHGADITIRVEDTGPGIAARTPPTRLQSFLQGRPGARGRRHGGSGLGLSIVKAIVERHGGRVSVARGEPGGAVFDMLLPANGSAAAS